MSDTDDNPTSAQWVVDCNEPHTGIILHFNECNEDGVLAFETAMPPLAALDLAAEIVWRARHLLAGEDHCICDDEGAGQP